MTDHTMPRRELEFLLYQWLDVVALTSRDRFNEHSAETITGVLDLAEVLATKEFAPHNRLGDVHEPSIREDGTVALAPEAERAIAAYLRSGLSSAGFDAELGGMQLPATVQLATALLLSSANFSTTGYVFLASAAAALLVAHASPAVVERYARPMIEGRYFGTMCISEPGVGSSLGDISTRALPEAEGAYRLTGTKMWISAGDHEMGENIVHLVLARIDGAPAGVKGLSLFAVPKFLMHDDGRRERNDVVLVGLNHKLGNRGTVNTVLGFGEDAHRPGGAAGAVGYLVGQEGGGLTAMFHMMNEARIAVGAGATALGYAGYLASVDYARSRHQGRASTQRDPQSAQLPLIDHPDVRRMLLAQKAYVEGSAALVLYGARLLDDATTHPVPEQAERAATLLDVLTPIAKSFPAQWCLAANDLAIQVHGGYGYTRDFPVEQYYRDNRLNMIHEGTHGIQALDLLGRKVRDQRGLQMLAETIRTTADRATAVGGEATGWAQALRACLDEALDVTALVRSHPEPEVALANATAYLEAMGHLVIAWIWLELVLAVQDSPGDFAQGKRAAARYFFVHELPRVSRQLALVASFDRSTLDLDPAWL